MTREVITAKEDDSVVDVARLISENRLHAVPIVDERQFLRGIIAESDFFTKSGSEEIHIPSYIELLQKLRFKETAGTDEKEQIRTLLLAKAGDIMAKDCATIGENDDVKMLLDMIRKTGFSSIPVVDEEMRLIGIVAVGDALKALVPEENHQEARTIPSRNIDREAGTSYSWLGERFKLVKTCRVNTVVAFLIIAFFAGALASVIFLRALETII
jgi:CBS-domain-containing membrane protein